MQNKFKTKIFPNIKSGLTLNFCDCLVPVLSLLVTVIRQYRFLIFGQWLTCKSRLLLAVNQPVLSMSPRVTPMFGLVFSWPNTCLNLA